MTTTTAPRAPRPAGLPALAPRAAGEPAHEYGFRALLFAVAEGPEWVEDTAALALADHVFPAAITNPEISPRALEVLQAVRDRITACLRRRATAPAQVADVAPPAGTAGKPPAGPMAPLKPAPKGGPAAPQAIVAPRGSQGPARPVQAPRPVAPAPVAPVRPALAPLVADPF